MPRCEFCTTDIGERLPENLALLTHVERSASCRQQYELALENVRASWTFAMSGG